MKRQILENIAGLGISVVLGGISGYITSRGHGEIYTLIASTILGIPYSVKSGSKYEESRK